MTAYKRREHRAEFVKPVPDEPDFVKGYSNGLAYRIVRHPVMGHLCGYVKLTKHHPLYKAATARLTRPKWGRPGQVETVRRGYNQRDLARLDVHGGTTFFDKLSWARGYWVGFDCAHFDDTVPSMIVFGGLPKEYQGVYRDVAFVKEQVDQLAQQLASMAASFGSYQNRRG